MEEYTIQTVARNNVGKRNNIVLRKKGLIPGIIYNDKTNIIISILHHDYIMNYLEEDSFVSGVINLYVDKIAYKVIIKDVLRHPYKNQILHMDFQIISDEDIINMHVPFKFIGSNIAPGIKAGGTIAYLMNEIEISCIPKKLPKYIDIDLSNMNVSNMIYTNDITWPEGVNPTNKLHNYPIVTIHAPKAKK
jgi:large subunit ribosomal protein L25